MRANDFLFENKTTLNSTGRMIARTPEAIERFWAWFGRSKIKDREGRPIVAYHGTTADFRSFDPKLSNTNTFTGVPNGAFVFTNAADVAVSYMTHDAEKKDFATPALRAEFQRLMTSGTFDQQMDFLHDNPLQPAPEYKDGGNVMPVYLRIAKPLLINAKGDVWHDIYFKPKGYTSPESFTTNEIASYAMEQGYDGVVIKNVKDVHRPPVIESTIYFVFSPNQIKSAIGNSGTYGAGSGIDEDAENP